MVTYKTKKNKGNYLTANNPKGKKVLKYMHKMCEKSLDYCEEQGLTSLEDFAEALESISESDHPKLKIDVTVNSGGIAMKMAAQPELGSTTGRYMMQHLGFAEEDQGKFTRTGVESTLNPEPEESLDDDLDLLDELDEEEVDEAETETEIDDLLDDDSDDFDDLWDDEEEDTKPKPTKQPKQSQPPQPTVQSSASPNPNPDPDDKPGIDYDSILDRAAGFSATAATQGQEVDGINVGGLSAQMALLAAVVGKKAAHKIMSAAQDMGQEKKVNQIVERIKAAQERTDELTERSEQLTESVEKSLEPAVDETEEDTEDSPGEVLANMVSQLDEQLDKTGLGEKKSKKQSFQVDKNASFEEQLQEISTALERIEQRLDHLEERIEALEEALHNSTPESAENESESKEPLNLTPTTPKASLYFDGGSRRNPGMAAGAAVVILPDGETHTTAEFMGKGTNNQAEYTGLIAGLKKAQELGCTDLEIHGDSRLVIDQLQGEKRVRSPHLKPLYQEAQTLLSQFNSTELNWIKREENTLADQAVNNCLDEQLQSQDDVEVNESEPSPPSDSTQDCANILMNLYNFEEKVAAQSGQSVEDGIMLGDNAILYANREGDATTISIEQLNGEELFAAVQRGNQGEWELLNDSLSAEDKREIGRLENLPKEVEAKRSQRQVSQAGLQM